jgi:lysine 2,3-aminomutase
MKKNFQPVFDKGQRTLRTVDDLANEGFVLSTERQSLESVAELYEIAVTPEVTKIIDKNDANDPIAKQYLPSVKELKILPEERQDPIGDYAHSPVKALVHRHRDRVLLKVTHSCAVYCRFCFRRDMVGADGDAITQTDIDQALDYIVQHDEISEVILTGGDPLILAPKKLGALINRLQTIPHVKWLRIHTRIPAVAPEKIDSDMLEALSTIKPVLMAVHINHAREMTVNVGAALARLAHQGIMLLGQSVLLKGVNDNVGALQELFETMLQHRIKPYYLHHPDLTVGTSHFRMSLEEGMALMNTLRQHVSGIAIPNYVLDIPGGYTKIPLTSDYVRLHPTQPNTYFLTEPGGKEHMYHDILG